MSTTKSIGSSGRDYSTVALWIAAIPSTPTGGYIGEMYNDSEFSTSTATVLSGFTTSAANYITLTAATGQSFRDAGSTILAYDSTKGVAWKCTGTYNNSKTFDVINDYVTVSKIQFKNTAASARRCFGIASGASAAHCVVDSLIIETPGAQDSTGCSLISNCTDATNVLIVIRGTSTAGPALDARSDTGGGKLINFTIVRPSNFTAGGTGIATLYNAQTIKNCAIFGFTTPIDNNKPGSATYLGTDQSTANGPGTGNVYNIAFTTATFTVVTDTGHDYKLVSGSGLLDVGTNTGAPAADIFGTSRPQNTTVDIGCFELPAGGGVSVALTGVSATGALGTFGKSVVHALTGIEGTGALGTLGKSISHALIGNEATGSLGTITPSSAGPVTLALTGISAMGFLGTVTPSGGVIFDTHDGGPKRRKKHEEQKKKEERDYRERQERRRRQMIEAFEQVIDGKVSRETIEEPNIEQVIAPAAEYAVNTLEITDKSDTDFNKWLKNLANAERILDDYLERDDEDVLVLL